MYRFTSKTLALILVHISFFHELNADLCEEKFANKSMNIIEINLEPFNKYARSLTNPQFQSLPSEIENLRINGISTKTILKKIHDAYVRLSDINRKANRETLEALTSFLLVHWPSVTQNSPDRKDEFFEVLTEIAHKADESPEIAFFLMRKKLKRHYRLDEIINCRP